MIGAIAGDIIGSVYEHQPIKTKDFPLFQAQSRFTDDSVLRVAIASAILDNTPYADAVRQIGRQYPSAGYGGSFIQWLAAVNAGPYRSWSNGAAMRTSLARALTFVAAMLQPALTIATSKQHYACRCILIDNANGNCQNNT
ncbi:hypothetical protein VRRI112168_15895 [Vreelandella rituensis]|uniref:ADP-ribosylglycohydrolase n=1 Tax=Vreelandella rituensis TaxID=2282306 RepID=A0A368U2Y7_9GAMM|nr:hypothetical protein [Halomonas rituensis]RCV91418.1 hypothetical protein DU506_10375 [Halomonas rituensis]